MRIRRNNRFSHVGRGLFSYRYIKRNLLVAAATIVTAAGIGLVVKYGEALDHSPAYLNSQTAQTASVGTTTEEAATVDVAALQTSTTKKAAQKKTVVAKAEEKSEFDGKFIAKINDTLNIREEATTDSNIVGKLFDGNVGDVLETSGEWTKISSGDVIGYVNRDYILTGKDAETYAEDYKKVLGTVTDDTVRVRADKSTQSDILGLVAKDTVLSVKTQDKDWVEVTMNDGTDGYIAADYITVEETYEYAMSIDDYTAMVEAEQQKAYEVVSTDDSADIMTADEETTETATTETPTTEGATEADTEVSTTEATTEEKSDDSSKIDASQYDDAYLLACLVSMEAGYESYEGQLAVANVVLNRVRSGKWGSSISSVIYAPNQFPCATGSVMQGYLQDGPLSTAQQAANDALAGNNNIGSFMSFLNKNYIDTDSLSDYQIIGNHCFY